MDLYAKGQYAERWGAGGLGEGIGHSASKLKTCAKAQKGGPRAEAACECFQGLG